MCLTLAEWFGEVLGLPKPNPGAYNWLVGCLLPRETRRFYDAARKVNRYAPDTLRLAWGLAAALHVLRNLSGEGGRAVFQAIGRAHAQR